MILVYRAVALEILYLALAGLLPLWPVGARASLPVGGVVAGGLAMGDEHLLVNAGLVALVRERAGRGKGGCGRFEHVGGFCRVERDVLGRPGEGARARRIEVVVPVGDGVALLAAFDEGVGDQRIHARGIVLGCRRGEFAVTTDAVRRLVGAVGVRAHERREALVEGVVALGVHKEGGLLARGRRWIAVQWALVEVDHPRRGLVAQLDPVGVVELRGVILASGDGESRVQAPAGRALGNENPAVRVHGLHDTGSERRHGVGLHHLPRQRAVLSRDAEHVLGVAQGVGILDAGFASEDREGLARDGDEDAEAQRVDGDVQDARLDVAVGDVVVVSSQLEIDADDSGPPFLPKLRLEVAVAMLPGADVQIEFAVGRHRVRGSGGVISRQVGRAAPGA